ncbi:MAG: hypothetical protein V9H69_21115 [Anaerolineae bacterium]
MLQFIDSRSGLLRARQMGELYYFAHRTFQEYLAARWMASADALQRIPAAHRRPQLARGDPVGLWLPDLQAGATGRRADRHPRANAARGGERGPTGVSRCCWARPMVACCSPTARRQSAHQKAAAQVMAHMPVLLRQAMQTARLDDPAIAVKTLARQRLEAGLLLADLGPAEAEDGRLRGRSPARRGASAATRVTNRESPALRG